MIKKKELKKRNYINDDLTRRERETQRHLKDKIKEEKEKRNNIKLD